MEDTQKNNTNYKGKNGNNNITWFLIAFVAFSFGLFLPLKLIHAAELTHYAGNLETTGPSLNMRAYFTAPSDINTFSYAFRYVPSGLNCSNNEDQFQIRRVDNNDLVSIMPNDSCVEVSSGVLRNGPFLYNNATSGVAYYASGGTNFTDRTYLGDGDLDFNFVLSSTTTPPTPPGPPVGTVTRVELVSPTNNSTTTSTSTTFTWQYYINSSTNNSSSSVPTNFILYYWAFPLASVNKITIPFTPVYDTLTTYSTTTTLINNRNYGWYVNMNANYVIPACSNVNLASVYCAFQQASQGLSQIATTASWRFTIGVSPYTNISTLTDAVFNDIAGTGNVEIMGQCTLIATSTCDATSPSTYSGCLFNATVAAFCPSASVINYATSTVYGSLSNKKVFSTFFTVIEPFENIYSSTTPFEGSNIDVDIEAVGGITEIWDWQDAHDFMHNIIDEEDMTIFIWLEWIVMTGLIVWFILKFF